MCITKKKEILYHTSNQQHSDININDNMPGNYTNASITNRVDITDSSTRMNTITNAATAYLYNNQITYSG